MHSLDIEELLISFSIFRDLDEDEMIKIKSISIVRNYPKGSHVFMQGDPLQNVYFIAEGKIKIYKSDVSGREQIVSILKNGDMFPHIGFFRKGGYPAFSEALEPSTLVVVPIHKFEMILVENPHLSMKFFKVLGEKIVDLQDRLEEKILNNTYEQIIKLIVRLGRIHGTEEKNGSILLKGEFTNKDLANMIGTTRETVSRTITKLRKENLIVIDEKGNMSFQPTVLLNELV